MVGKTRGKTLVIDTYAIIADLTGNISPKARRALDLVRIGEADGIIHFLLIYELAYFWRKTGLVFKNLAEVEEFLKTYFKIVELTPGLAIEASGVKAEGDSILRKSDDSSLYSRRLSVADAVTLTIAMKLGAQIVTGDKDLTYVAQHMGVNVIW
jgi:predicted nucleic acid-binding protein